MKTRRINPDQCFLFCDYTKKEKLFRGKTARMRLTVRGNGFWTVGGNLGQFSSGLVSFIQRLVQ